MDVEILTAVGRDPGLKYTSTVAERLLKNGCSVYAPYIKGMLPNGVSSEICKTPQLEIVLGGDGSIMRASHFAARVGAPIIGINLGHVGYLAELDLSEIDYLDKFFAGEYRIEKRSMLSVCHIRDGKLIGRPTLALNDAVITHGKISKILDIEVFCSGETLGKYRADGFIVSTPTGSTAYSLAAGGPVLDPDISGVCLVPICPHSLTTRPLVVPDSKEIEVRYLGHAGIVALSVDGGDTASLEPGDSVIINRAEATADFVRFDKGHDAGFYSTFRNKLSEA